MSCMETEPQGDYVIEHITLRVFIITANIMHIMLLNFVS